MAMPHAQDDRRPGRKEPDRECLLSVDPAVLFQPVPCLPLPKAVGAEVDRGLGGWGMTVRPMEAAEALGPPRAHHEPCVALAAELSAVIEWESRIVPAGSLRNPPFLILGLWEDRKLLRFLPPGSDLLFLPHEIAALPTRFLRLRADDWRARVVECIRTSGPVSLVLRQALLAVVRQDLHDRRESGVSLPTLTDLAFRIGVSREHLSRKAHSQDIDLRRFVDGWAALTVVFAHHLHGMSLSEIAVWLGYRWGSGLTGLFRRTWGISPSEALEVPPEGSMRAWVDQMLAPILQFEGTANERRSH